MLQVLGILAVLLAGAFVCAVFVWSAPETVPEEKAEVPTIVQTMEIEPRRVAITVTAYGPVIPARQATIKPQVDGLIVRHHPALEPGGHLPAGTEVIGIEESDYELALTAEQSEFEEARYEFEIEKGRQVVAEREWRILSSELPEGEVNRSLVLREPHLRRTEALLLKATNDIAMARLNLSRTSITAPFNAMVLKESVEVGQLVEAGSEICTLVGTDEFWVQATLPLDKLQSIRLPIPGREGSVATVFLDTGNDAHPPQWKGRVLRLFSDLVPDSRMARVLVEVRDPLGLKSRNSPFPLLIGSYVRIEIEAGELDNVLVVPRSALREGNQIWFVDTGNRLRIEEVRILWTQQDAHYVDNVMRPGERLIVSRLKAPLPGMKVEAVPSSLKPPKPSSRSTSTNPLGP